MPEDTPDFSAPPSPPAFNPVDAFSPPPSPPGFPDLSNTPPDPTPADTSTIGSGAPDPTPVDGPSQIDVDRSNVAIAQAALDAAQARLAADQAFIDEAVAAKLATVRPHLSVLAQIESEVVAQFSSEWTGAEAVFHAMQERVSPLIAKLRALLTS